MLKTILQFHWKAARMPLLLGSVAVFAMPLASVQRWAWDAGAAGDGAFMLQSMAMWAIGYPLLATAVGLLVAVTAWSADHRGKHVYALTLPVPRWKFVLTRFGAGATLLALPVGALAAGSLLAGGATMIPAGLSVYPLALTLRFALAAGVAFAVFFAISSGTSRTAGVVLGSLLGVGLTQVGFEALNVDIDIFNYLVNKMLNWPGPFDVFGGRWMLIDV